MDNKQEKTSNILKEIIDSYASEKIIFFQFISEKKLQGEFIKYCAEYTKKMSVLNSGYSDND